MQPGQLPRRLGLIVGLNHYQDSTFRPLRFAEGDAKALAQWFVNTKGGRWNPPDLQHVQGQRATKELVQSLLTQLCLQVAETGDEVVFYFAGHAFVDERSGDGYLALANTRYQDVGTAISVRTLIQSVQSQSRAGRILCIFDCFQTGQVWDMRRISQYDSKPLLGTATVATLQQSVDRLCLCSCRGNAFAGEVGEGALGAFAHRLLIGLCGTATEAVLGKVTLAKLHAYLFSNLSEQHRPQLFGQQTSPFVLVGQPVSAATSNTQLSPSPSSPSPKGSHADQDLVKSPAERSKTGLLKVYGSASSSASASASQTASPPADSDQAPSERSKTGLLKVYGSASSSASASASQTASPSADSGQAPSERSKTGLLKVYGSASSSASASASQTASPPADSGQAPSPNGSLPQAVSSEQEQYKQILEQAQQYNQRQNYKEAFDLVEQVLRMVPNDIAALTLKGQLLGTAGRLPDAMVIVEQILQRDPNNALAWSMRAVLLSNMGQQQEALSAIERSLEIDSNNPESYGIKTHIMEMLASQQVQRGERVVAPVSGVSQKPVPLGTGPEARKDNPRAFFMAAGVQGLGFVLGAVGAASPYFLSQTVPYASLALASLGLATMCVVATQGAFRYGFTRVVLTILFAVLSLVILGGGYQILGLPRILANVQAQTQVALQAAVIRLLAFGFIGMWLAAAALLPFLGAVGGFFAGMLRRRYIGDRNGL